MNFWLLDVKSTVVVNGTDVAFDYINTYYEKNDAIMEAKLLSMDDNVLEVSVHKWILKEVERKNMLMLQPIMMQYHTDFLTKIIESGSEGEIMEKRKTRFNEFGCDKVHKIPKEEIYRFMKNNLNI